MTSAFAQLSVTGVVINEEDQKALPGAYVYPLTEPSRVVTTDATGHFELTLSQPDTLMVRFLGFAIHRQYIATTADLRIALRPAGINDGVAVTVKAKKIRYGELASEQISQLEIYVNPAAKADPLLAVNSLPAATNPDETANVSLRGSPSEATGVYLNDVPIRSAVRLDQSNGVGQFSIFSQVPLEDVRVYSSHPPVSFSQTSAGAVALYTRPELPTSTRFGLSLNLAGMGGSFAQPLGQNSGVRAFVNYGNLSAFRQLNQNGLPELQRSRSLDMTLQFLHRFSKRSNVQLFYLGFLENYRFLTRTPYYEGSFSQQKPRHLAVLNWSINNEKWSWRFNQSIDWEKPRFTLGNINTQPRRLSGHFAVHGRYQLPGFTLQTGSSINIYDDKVVGSFPLINYALAPEDPAGNYQTATAHQVTEAYAYGQLRLGDHWLAGLGIKPIAQPGEDPLRTTLQASLRYRPNTAHRIIFGGGIFNQFMSPGPAIPEWQWLTLQQVALEYTFQRDGWTLEAALYDKQERYERANDLSVRGGEFRLQYESSNALAWISGAMVSSKTRANDVPSRRDIPFLIRAQYRRNFTGGWTIGFSANYRRGTYFLPLIGRTPLADTEDWYAPILAAPTEGERYPNYRRIDFSCSKMIVGDKTQLVLYANVNNLLNHQNISSYSYDASYSQRSEVYYSRRLLFFGAVLSW
ncbi:MAG: carboxypeptidase-like regulatory domain-containing protein [Bacteroidota bacterium]